MAKETSAGAVLFRRDGREVLYLLLHHGEDHWDFPKGNVEEGEDDHATVRREVLEETGIAAIDFVGSFQETVRYSYIWKGLSINKTVRFYLAETRQSEVTISEEHSGYAWLPFREAEERLTHDKSKNVLRSSRAALV
jgi:8-oxo-dGTP pyrophosphatase MutT (NUDIX family)